MKTSRIIQMANRFEATLKMKKEFVAYVLSPAEHNN